MPEFLEWFKFTGWCHLLAAHFLNNRFCSLWIIVLLLNTEGKSLQMMDANQEMWALLYCLITSVGRLLIHVIQMRRSYSHSEIIWDLSVQLLLWTTVQLGATPLFKYNICLYSIPVTNKSKEKIIEYLSFLWCVMSCSGLCAHILRSIPSWIAVTVLTNSACSADV